MHIKQESLLERILDSSGKLGLSPTVKITAQLLYYDMMQNSDENPPENEVKAAAIILSSKIHHVPIEKKAIIKEFFHLDMDKLYNLTMADKLNQNLAALDRKMHRRWIERGFPQLAYQYVVVFLSHIFQLSREADLFRVVISETAMRLVNDFYRLKISVTFEGRHIAVACIHFALLQHGAFLHLMKSEKEWYKIFCKDLEHKVLVDLQTYLLSLVEEDILRRKTQSLKEQKEAAELANIEDNAQKSANKNPPKDITNPFVKYLYKAKEKEEILKSQLQVDTSKSDSTDGIELLNSTFKKIKEVEYVKEKRYSRHHRRPKKLNKPSSVTHSEASSEEEEVSCEEEEESPRKIRHRKPQKKSKH